MAAFVPVTPLHVLVAEALADATLDGAQGSDGSALGTAATTTTTAAAGTASESATRGSAARATPRTTSRDTPAASPSRGKSLPFFTHNTLCAVLQSNALTADAIAATRRAVRARVFERFPRLTALYRRADEAAVPYSDDGDDSDDERNGYGYWLGGAREIDTRTRIVRALARRAAVPEITVDVVTALLRIYDGLVFNGALAASFHARRWHLDVAVGDWPTDGVRLIKCDDESMRPPLPPPRTYNGVLVEVSVRTPSAYCFDDGAQVAIFGVQCADALDVLLVQVEHQLVHAALLVGGCADADARTARALLHAKDDPEAADVRVKLDALPHGGAMAAAAANVFGHTTPSHGPHVWAVPAHGGNETRACCAFEAIPRFERDVEKLPTRPRSLWMHRNALRTVAAAGDRRSGLEVAAFDPSVARWQSGMELLRVGRWFAELAPASSSCTTALLRVPLPFVTTVARGTRPDGRKRPGGFWSTLSYGAVVLRLPPPTDDLARYDGAADVGAVRDMSRKKAASYAEAFVDGLERAEFRGSADKYGTRVTLRTADGNSTITVPADTIIPESYVTDDPRAPSAWEDVN